MIRTMLSPPLMTALLLSGVILAIAGTVSLRHQRRVIPVVADPRRARRAERVEDRVIQVSTTVLVLSALVVAFILLG